MLAAVVEMIHTATLVHDDVLDEAVIRRHAATVNAEWGNETAVLLGDYLFTHAFHLAASLESTRACRWIGAATNRVCEGEMQQVFHRGNLGLHERDYFEIIEAKTAELTAVSCRLGAFYAGASESTVAALDAYGRNLGIAFQIADDVLDIWGEERATGKSLGTDLKQQKLTLPVIKLLARSPGRSPGRKYAVWLRAQNQKRGAGCKPLLEESGALEPRLASRQAARETRNRLSRLPRRFRSHHRLAHARPVCHPTAVLTSKVVPVRETHGDRNGLPALAQLLIVLTIARLFQNRIESAP